MMFWGKKLKTCIRNQELDLIIFKIFIQFNLEKVKNQK